MKPELVASAKPNDHKVMVMSKIFVYSRIRKRELDEDKCYVHLLHQAAKITLHRVTQIVHENKDDWRELEKLKPFVSLTGSMTIGSLSSQIKD